MQGICRRKKSSNSSESLLSPVGSILNPLRGGLGGEGPGLYALARLACWRALLLPTSSSGEASFLLLELLSARCFGMFSLAWCSWFLRFEISLCARVSSFFSLAYVDLNHRIYAADHCSCQKAPCFWSQSGPA